MSLHKKYLKSKPVCKVTFTVDKDLAKEAGKVFLAGEFNGWATEATPMKKQKNGNFSVTLDLETGREYQYRYFLGDGQWLSDPAADKSAFSPFGDCDNSVVEL
ncbi:isoamylase early set domain-containing protein [Desulfolutivibrio sulfoxidireducens]|uniref:isoamylase early set domain-containing protein n=1 Tax=Desulfolutivibrio sulfoxidireducens TaxID=2773299 RepID=UPI00159D0AC5|nr:isoamylase early set domain-containing protein [Desulfolutivibrio sulfoxidireducens]QLA17171.1 glycoside hydrolase [Desulfolutivibrio sulfoxidireducens]QLA20742.1 glycoside hydrolase [Desulfolutivibrio sulfoxidireducens]